MHRLVLTLPALYAKLSFCQEDWSQLHLQVSPSVFYLLKQTWLASGFFLNQQGYGITVHHYYEDIQKDISSCRLYYKGNSYPVKIIHADKANDILVIKAKGLTATPFLHLAKKTPPLGQRAVLFGHFPTLAMGFEAGYVLEADYDKLKKISIKGLRSSCRGWPGFSGGPLVNLQCEVLGIQNSISKLFENAVDSVCVPADVIRESLKKVARETEEGWVFSK